MERWKRCEADRRRVAAIMREVYRSGFDRAGMASVGLRVGGDSFLIGVAGSSLVPGVVGLFGCEGKCLGPELWPGDDFDLHRTVFRRRGDVMAVVHAQPVNATAFAAAGKTVNTAVTQEAYLGVGEVGVVGYAPRRTRQMAEGVVDGLGDYGRAVLVKGLGVVAVGESLEGALRVMRLVEMAAEVEVVARGLGAGVVGLSADERRAADEV